MSEDTMVVNGATYPVAYSMLLVPNGIEVTVKGCIIGEHVICNEVSNGDVAWRLASIDTLEDTAKVVKILVEHVVQTVESRKGADYVNEIAPKVEAEINEILKKYDVHIDISYDNGGVALWGPYKPFSFDRSEE